jgi:FAD synthetase
MSTVLVFGTFDLLHKGHQYFLYRARRRGDRLVVVVGTDRNVRKFKGRAPVEDEVERLRKVSELPFVDEAMFGREDLAYQRIISKVRPSMICLGYDQDSLGLEKNIKGKDIEIVRLEPYKESEFKSSILRLRMNKVSETAAAVK